MKVRVNLKTQIDRIFERQSAPPPPPPPSPSPRNPAQQIRSVSNGFEGMVGGYVE